MKLKLVHILEVTKAELHLLDALNLAHKQVNQLLQGGMKLEDLCNACLACRITKIVYPHAKNPPFEGYYPLAEIIVLVQLANGTPVDKLERPRKDSEARPVYDFAIREYLKRHGQDHPTKKH